MKKLLSVLTVLTMIVSCTSCGLFKTYEATEMAEITGVDAPERETIPDDVKSRTVEITSESTTEISTEAVTEKNTVKADPVRQECHKTIKNEEKPEVTRISFEGVCSDNIKKLAKVKDLYNINVLHSEVVGLVGIPVELTFEDEVKDPRLTFTYDTNELRGIPEKNLVMLHYSEEDAFYNTVENFKLDTDKCTVSADIKEQGVYLLVDAFQWYSCWGMDVSEYAYDRDLTQYKTDWERECDTGSIMALADKQWAMDNAPDFKVSTAEQLASVVWYVNGIEGNGINISLEKDIDLSDYQWKPMGWGHGTNNFSGTVDGNGHTIYGMTITENYVQAGFIGYGLGVTVKNINFEDAYVSATHCIGIVGGEIYMCSEPWENIHVQGTVDGGDDDYACIVGRETDISFKNCTADVTVDGEVFEYLSYRQKREDEVEIVETFNLTLNDDYTITRDEHEGFHNLGWTILKGDQQILDRLAENELTLDTHKWVGDSPAKYTIYLTAYINGTYIRVSNIIKYTLTEDID